MGGWDDSTTSNTSNGDGAGGASGQNCDSNSAMTGLVELYSHFQPRTSERSKSTMVIGVGGEEQRTTTQILSSRVTVVEYISLEPHELFSQLCTAALLVTHGPRSGLYRRFVTIAEGTVRVWRDWLADRAASSSSCRDDEGLLNGSTHDMSTASAVDEGILWVDTRRNFGMRVRIRENRMGDQPILMQQDENPHVTYSYEIEGMEFTLSRVFNHWVSDQEFLL